jgi:hypothetical protein
VLILDKVNDEKFNSAGIDIRPHIKFLLNDFQAQIGLMYQKSYVSELQKLADKYDIS